MIIAPDKNCSIFWGNATKCPVRHHDLKQFKLFYNKLRQQLGLTHIIFQQQIHGIDGLVITNTTQLINPVMKEEHTGDYLITSVVNVGIGVLTADCLPIILYAPKHNIVAAFHAGWRSAIAGIGQKVITQLQKDFGITPTNIQVYFGPSAKNCCYQVGIEWKNYTTQQPYLVKRNNTLYFDNPGFNKALIVAAGVPIANINEQYNDCTICNHQYHSYRRAIDKKHYGVQATIVWLH